MAAISHTAQNGTDTAHDPELKYWVAVHRVYGIGPKRIAQLLAHFGSLELAWTASFSDIASSGVGEENAKTLYALRSQTSPEREMERLQELGIRAVRLDSPAYPKRLAQTYDPPPVIYYRGELPADDPAAVAIVGSRRCTSYGREMTRRIGAGLARSGVSIYSGLARGIDGAAHRAALDAKGKTVAVLGGGLDAIYPREHESLASEIVETDGALVTEYPVGTVARREHFPRRNRVISGLTRGVVVVEAARKSGAMLTVKWALEQDREVFAVPGSVMSENSAGPNWLIQQGAKLTTSHLDVLDELSITPKTAEPAVSKREVTQGELGVDSLARKNNGTDIESRIVQHLAEIGAPCHADEIARSINAQVAEVTSALSVLALNGSVDEVGPMTFLASAVESSS